MREEEYGIQYAQLSKRLIRDARSTAQSQNHLYKLLHRGYTGKINSGEDIKAWPPAPTSSTKNGSQTQLARKPWWKPSPPTPGTAECPIAGIPNDARLKYE